jgi:hypothetical protein
MVFSLEHDIKVTKSHQNLLPTQSVIVAHTVDLLIVNPTVKKIFNLHKKFPEKTYFFLITITFSRLSKRPNRHYQQKAFLKY